MLDHHLQRTIVYRLALANRMRFSELKPDDVENKLFTYHLRKVITAGLIKKDAEGFYKLTAEGRRLGVRVFDNEQAIIDRPVSVLFLVVRRKTDGAWLLYTRQTHPLRGKTGFMHAHPNASEPIETTAAHALRERTGLVCTFQALGGGYFRVYQQGELESFTHFTLLHCDAAEGELLPQDKHATYAWHDQPDFASQAMLPNMKILHEQYQKGEPFFIEHTFRL